MEVGQRCRLLLADCTSTHATNSSDDIHSNGFTVTGVVVGVRPHAEEPWRRLYYVHCTHIEFGAELARQRRKAAAPSWSGAPLSTIGSGTIHSCNELRAAGGSFVSNGGYHYRYDGWYDAFALAPLSADVFLANNTAAMASAGSSPPEPPATVSEPRDDEGAASVPAVSHLPGQHREAPEEWVTAMERDTAVCEVVYLCYAFQPWFPAPYSALQYLALPEDDVCHSVYVCHRCLSPFFTREQYYVHLAGEYCRLRTPPGRLIYHDGDAGYKAFLVDGAKDLHYGRCLSLLGKQLIESKVLSNDVDLYEYVVVTIPRASLPYIPAALPSCTSAEQCGVDNLVALSREGFRQAASDFDAEDWDGDAVMGYFSRLKHHPDHTLSCIVTLPMFQRTRVATFLLDVAYWMTRQRQRLCGCGFCGQSGGAISRPFSPHGQSLLLSYWRRALLRSLAEVAPLHRRASRAAQPELRFTLAELRALMDIPIHTDDMETLLLQSEFAFYQPAAASAALARYSDDDDSTSPPTSPTSAKRGQRRERGSTSTSLKDSQASSGSKLSSSSAGGSAGNGGSSTSGARYTATLVLEATLLEAAAEFHTKKPRSCVMFDKRWLVKDGRGAYAYDTPYFHH
ncbi:putative MOZ/SAS family acetyltransferase [Leishmania infantum JPCM5]|uniref:Histone acetyltransferase n=2 Tax=Leishmania infantum TaxID=5671 RepID=A0A6L0WVW3_LEIIN|nr:putative MOZ/SAS family acetyltransferase [Leishmania infantum JPCM5]CAC9464769.1 MOZ/SAS_family_acetyltransferase_-_putative [Leishmania infantum]CAM66419.1 putative MOZ/SAS family acetyltransferase [Leishmania infantum JPCM5]SUZ40066.1 MOZ/SAS_family_acetyltransferase_-_putative [Leishmania infantum]|eukprot:XP_001464044.1 putative MOZ/SAS family acetyltransferase [Leishmania infantum JPCM5]